MKPFILTLFFFLFQLGYNQAQDAPSSCSCMGDCIGSSYSNLLEQLVDFETIENELAWKLEGGKELFESLFYRNLIGDSNRRSFLYTLKLESSDPLRFTHPKDYYTLNLLPCQNDDLFFTLPMEVSYRHDLARSLPDFDFTTFDQSPESYYKVLIARARIDDVKFLEAAMQENPLQWKGKGKQYNVKEFMDKIIKKNKVQIADFEAYETQDSITEYLYQLQQQKVDLAGIAVQHFVRYGKPIKKADATMEKRLQKLFGRWLGNFSYASIQRYTIQPIVKVNVQAKYVGVQLAPTMLREWNMAQNAPQLDSNQQVIGSTLLCTVQNLQYSSVYGVNAYSYETCMPVAEITGSGIFIQIEAANLITNINDTKPILTYNLYPQCLVDSTQQEGKYSYQYSTLLTDFSGLEIPTLQLDVPFQNTRLSLEATNLLLNNKVLLGTLLLEPVEKDKALTKQSLVSLKDNKGTVLNVALDQLLTALKKKKIKSQVVFQEGKPIAVYFIKKVK